MADRDILHHERWQEGWSVQPYALPWPNGWSVVAVDASGTPFGFTVQAGSPENAEKLARGLLDLLGDVTKPPPPVACPNEHCRDGVIVGTDGVGCAACAPNLPSPASGDQREAGRG